MPSTDLRTHLPHFPFSSEVPPYAVMRVTHACVPARTGEGGLLLHAGRGWNLQSFGGEFFCLALPTLRRGDDRGSEIYRCGIIPMRLLRFFVACPPLSAQGCAPARPRRRVLTPWRPVPAQVSAHTLAGTCDVINDHDPAFPVRRRLPNSRLGRQRAFKSHSAPRPPQTPAASS